MHANILPFNISFVLEQLELGFERLGFESDLRAIRVWEMSICEISIENLKSSKEKLRLRNLQSRANFLVFNFWVLFLIKNYFNEAG